jgi:hypothetical protein
MDVELTPNRLRHDYFAEEALKQREFADEGQVQKRRGVTDHLH